MLAKAAKVDYLALSQGVAARDALSLRLFRIVTAALGAGAVNLIHAYDPELLVLSGGACHVPGLCQRVSDYVAKYTWTPWGQVSVRAADDPESSVLWGLRHAAEHGLA